jgi:ribose-phosphate pyrophosphokinase
MKLMGNVSGKIAILVDDIIDTAGTACRACEVLKANGATSVYMLASHGLFSGNALSRIVASSFDKIIVTNTTPVPQVVKEHEKIETIDVSWLCAEAIHRQYMGESLKELYDCDSILEDNNIEIECL